MGATLLLLSSMINLFCIPYIPPCEDPSKKYHPTFEYRESSEFSTDHQDGIKITKEYRNYLKSREIHYKDNQVIKGIYWNRAGNKTKEVIYQGRKIVSVKEWYANKTLQYQKKFRQGVLIQHTVYRITGKKQSEMVLLANGVKMTRHYTTNEIRWLEELAYQRRKSETYFYIQNGQKRLKIDYVGGERWGCSYKWYLRSEKRWSIEGNPLHPKLKKGIGERLNITHHSDNYDTKYRFTLSGYPFSETQSQKDQLYGYKQWYFGGVVHFEFKSINQKDPSPRKNTKRLSLHVSNNSQKLNFKDGTLSIYTPEGIITAQIQYQNGDIVEERAYFPDGQIAKITHNTKKSIIYDQNGAKSQQVTYRNGRRVLEQKWFRDGSLKYHFILKKNRGYEWFYDHDTLQLHLVYSNYSLIQKQIPYLPLEKVSSEVYLPDYSSDVYEEYLKDINSKYYISWAESISIYPYYYRGQFCTPDFKLKKVNCVRYNPESGKKCSFTGTISKDKKIWYLDTSILKCTPDNSF